MICARYTEHERMMLREGFEDTLTRVMARAIRMSVLTFEAPTKRQRDDAADVLDRLSEALERLSNASWGLR